jgi:hypothetical protein
MVKVTMPVGIPEPGVFAATDAVKVTLWPVTDGLTDEITDVVVLSMFTTWVGLSEPEEVE